MRSPNKTAWGSHAPHNPSFLSTVENLEKPYFMSRVCNLSRLETEAGGSQVEGLPERLSECL